MKFFSALAALVLIVGYPAIVAAACSDPNQQSCSSNYGVSEAAFGTGGALCDTSNPTTSFQSTNYCAKSILGELGVGNTSSSSYQAQAGFNTNREPSLTFVVSTSSINLGGLRPGTTATATAQFAVQTYLASGYVVVTHSPGPMNGAYAFTTLTSPTASNASAEQFGINLVSNSSCGGGLPGSLGSDPLQVPDSSFSFGAAAAGYNTACQFKYVDGDTIASSSKSSGETDYTISYIINSTNATPGGTYTMNQVLVATSTF